MDIFHFILKNDLSSIMSLAKNKREFEKSLNNTKEGRTPLIQSIVYNHLKIAKFLIQQGADANARDRANNTPLLWAASISYPDNISMIDFLVEHGADLHAINDFGDNFLSVLCVDVKNQDTILKFIEKGVAIDCDSHHRFFNFLKNPKVKFELDFVLKNGNFTKKTSKETIKKMRMEKILGL